MMKIEYKQIVLRDLIAEDNWDYLRWNREETAWKKWNAPWAEPLILTPEKIQKDVDEFVPLADGVKRTAFEVCLSDGRHIGSVGAYYPYLPDRSKLAIGITISESGLWGKGIGTQAFAAFIRYWRETEPGITLYTETLSGNLGMLGLARKCGFEEVARARHFFQRDGNSYDSITFRLNLERFEAAGI